MDAPRVEGEHERLRVAVVAQLRHGPRRRSLPGDREHGRRARGRRPPRGRVPPAQLPLGRPDDAFRPGAYRGSNGTELGVYKVSGFYVSVAFDEALATSRP